jgi:pimeloyl-ACP methyl ester carboxylesterase
VTIVEQKDWTRGGLHFEDVTITVPFDHFGRSREAASASVNLPDTLSVFARIIATEADSRKPYLVYLQGGPGVEAPRPGIAGGPGGWVKRALEEFQVIMLDQRGTGKSSPIGSVDGAITGLDTVGADPAAIAEALSYFRADSIVEDAEILRGHLGADTWSLLGQSFGGFTTLRYISAHSSALNEVFFTGGLPAIGLDPATVYGRTWEGMIRKSEQYYTAFPGDREKMRRLVELASVGEGLALPGGARATPERIRLLGHFLGASDGPEKLHYLLDSDFGSAAFRHDLAASLPFSGRNPLYAVIHESCWADGTVTNWAARRAMPDAVAVRTRPCWPVSTPVRSLCTRIRSSRPSPKWPRSSPHVNGPASTMSTLCGPPRCVVLQQCTSKMPTCRWSIRWPRPSICPGCTRG